MNIHQLYQLFTASNGVSTDTRKIDEGTIFFALKGASFNGNTFAIKALEMGASYAVIDEAQEVVDKRLILVDDVLKTLQRLARYHRDHMETVVIGITGTNGKTTTKELVHAVLSSHYPTQATLGNLNNHIGVPLTLLSMPEDLDFAIIEMGANHVGEIAELCEICDPAFGIITNVGKAHLEGFGSFENIITTKKGLYEHIARREGAIFINSGNEILRENAVERQIFYGVDDNDECQGKLLDASPFVKLDVTTTEGTIRIQTKLIGAYNFENILAAACVGTYFQVPLERIKFALENYQPSNNRSEFRKTDNNELILDAYNANPSSMEKAIQNFAEMKQDNKIAILGDMFELGENSEQLHQEIASATMDLGVDAYFVGKEFKKVDNDSGRFFEQIEELIEKLQKDPLKNKTILIKGSRGIKLERLVEYL